MALDFRQADLARDRAVLTRFNIDYLNWIAEAVQERFGFSLTDLLGKPIPDYVEGALDKLCDGTPPTGVFYLVRQSDSPVGMGGLRQLREGVGEIKAGGSWLVPNQLDPRAAGEDPAPTDQSGSQHDHRGPDAVEENENDQDDE